MAYKPIRDFERVINKLDLTTPIGEQYNVDNLNYDKINNFTEAAGT